MRNESLDATVAYYNHICAVGDVVVFHDRMRADAFVFVFWYLLPNTCYLEVVVMATFVSAAIFPFVAEYIVQAKPSRNFFFKADISYILWYISYVFTTLRI